jgi:hypothetical protein
MLETHNERLNVIEKGIPFKEPQFTGVGGYSYMKL